MKRVTNSLPKISLFIVIGLVVELISQALGSSFVADFLESDLISILLALLAINITTVSVILTKLQELAAKGRLDYSAIIAEMRLSIKEQVGLIVIATIFLVLRSSQAILGLWVLADSALTVGLIAVLVYAILLMQSTGESVFKIAEIENEKMTAWHDAQSRGEANERQER